VKNLKRARGLLPTASPWEGHHHLPNNCEVGQGLPIETDGEAESGVG
jgi:hypothetical protein